MSNSKKTNHFDFCQKDQTFLLNDEPVNYHVVRFFCDGDFVTGERHPNATDNDTYSVEFSMFYALADAEYLAFRKKRGMVGS